MRSRVGWFCVLMGMGAVVGWGLFREGRIPDGKRLFTAGPSIAPIAQTPSGVSQGPLLARPEPILVDDFEVGDTQGLFAERKNRLDAFQGTWARRPSYTIITKVPDTRPGAKSSVLRIEFSKSGGWCGWYTLLNGIDVSRHNALTFWVKGEQGGERFDIGFADEKMQELEIDAVYVGPIMAFLPKGVTTEWQLVKIPMHSLRSDLDLTRMGSLVFWFRYEGKGAVQIDDVSFSSDPEVERILKENQPRATPDPRAPRASWVWKYDPVNSGEVRQELIDFCQRTGILSLYLYLGEDPVSQAPADFQKRLAEFLREAHAQGIEVHALQGNPLWALKGYHSLVLNWVKGYLDFNRGRPPEERIGGVHLDIEPYLTSEWETGDREKLKKEFLELLAELRRLVDTERRGAPFLLGAAIPIFYDREPEFEERLLKNVDYAALMDYYDTATDIIKSGRFHIDLANRLGKKMVIGVETQDLVRMGQGKRRNTFHEEGWQEMEAQLEMVVENFASEAGFGGLAIHAYDSYRLLQRGRNVPTRERPSDIPTLVAGRLSQPVVVDGDLSDWANASWTSFQQRSQVVYGVGAWGGPKDLNFKLATQWEPEALVIALEVTDDAHVQERRGADIWEGDHVEIWVDADLEGDYNEAVNSSDDFQFGFSPGNFKELKPEVYIWVPSVDPSSLRQIELAAQKLPTGYTLEIRLPTKVLFQTLTKRVGVEPTAQTGAKRSIPPEAEAIQREVFSTGRLKSGFRLGLMVDGSDADQATHPQKCLISSSPERQWGDPTSFNILELQ